MRPMEDGEFEIFLDSEEAPQIAGIVDERGPVDFTDKRRWKIVADNEGGDVKITSENRQKQYQSSTFEEEIENNVHKHSKRINHRDDQVEVNHGRQGEDSDGDLSPPRISKEERKKNKSISEAHDKRSESNSDNDLQSLRRETQYSDDDLSPPRIKNKKNKFQKEMHSNKNSKYNNNDCDTNFYRRKYSDNELSPNNKFKGTNKADRYEEDTNDFRKYKRTKCENDDDISPPRRRKYSNDDLSSPRKSEENKMLDKYERNIDKSRKYHEYSKNDCKDNINSSRRQIKYTDDDLSPARLSKEETRREKYKKVHYSKKHKCNEDTSPLRRQRTRLDDDLSPPRKSREKSRKGKYEKEMYEEKCLNDHHKQSKYGNNDDTSPRRHRKYPDDKYSRRPDQKSSHKYKERSELESLKRRHSSGRGDDSDLSPPRKNKEDNVRNDDLDLSPPRKDRRKSDFHDKSRKYKRSSRSLSYEREKGYDRSLPHKYTAQGERETTSRYKNEHLKKTLGGKKAGLKDLETLREEIETQKRHEAELNKLRKNNIEQSSLNVPIQRDRKRLLKAEAVEQRAKEERQAELDEKYAVWGKGLKQVEDHEEKLKRDLYEISKPLARYADDEDLNKEFREQEREEDPMLEYLKQKQIKEGKRKPDPPSYRGTFMPNRFGIKPGHRWDGVDRSNGYEKKWFEAQNAKVAWQEDAYKWSTADM